MCRTGCGRRFPSRASSFLILARPWVVKVKNSDGSIADVAAALSAVAAHRSSKREAWIVDAEGRRVDDAPDEAAD
jgi:hypothetical protein